jgi:hypothetical protein
MKRFCNLKSNCFTFNQIQYYTHIGFQKSHLPPVTSVELGKQGPVEAAPVEVAVARGGHEQPRQVRCADGGPRADGRVRGGITDDQGWGDIMGTDSQGRGGAGRGGGWPVVEVLGTSGGLASRAMGPLVGWHRGRPGWCRGRGPRWRQR